MEQVSQTIENVTPEFLSMIKLSDERGKRLNYLMVIPPHGNSDNTMYAFPAGFGIVTAALKVSGRNVFTLDLNFKQEPINLLKTVIINNKIDVLMTGGFSVGFWAMKNIIDTAKEIKPDTIIVVGGGIITADPAVAMEALENADYGVIGEGEITVNALAHALEYNYDPALLDGIICQRNRKWSIHEKFPVITDLDILPFPDYEGFEYGKLLENPVYTNKWTRRAGSNKIVFLNIARSCPFLCTFCFHTCGSRHKQMSMETIFKLIDWIRSLYPNIKAISIDGDLTFSNTQFAIEFCRRIKPYNLTWRANTRANVVTEEMFSALKESGCASIMFGIESANNEILKSMRKGITIEQVEKAFRIAEEVGIYARGTLIFGDTEETWETFLSTIEWYLTNRKWSTVDNFWNITLGMIKAYPGTHLYKLACERGIIKDRIQFLKDGCPPINLSKMSDDEYNVIPELFHILQSGNKLNEAIVKPNDDYTVNVAGRCPYCSQIISFERCKFIFNSKKISCPVCKKDVTVIPIEYCDSNKLIKNIETLIAGRSVAVWAVNLSNFYLMLKLIPVLKIDNVRFINKDEIKVFKTVRNANNYTDKEIVVKTLAGKKVFRPDIIRIENIQTVIVPNNPEVFNSIKEQIASEYPQVRQIVHITELF